MDVFKLNKIDYLALVVPVLLGALSILLWLLEIIHLKGWFGINWMTSELISVYLITFLVVLSYILPVLMTIKVNSINIFFQIYIS